MFRIDEIQKDIYRINAYNDQVGLSFSQFLIRDEAPALIHTGVYSAYDGIREQIRQVLDPATLRYIVIPHFEGDECGGIDRFLAEARGARLVCSAVGAAINLQPGVWNPDGFGSRDPITVWQDDTLELGRKRLRFLMTPHVHHWDSMMVLEETEGALFPADLFIQPGEQPPVSCEDHSAGMIQLYREAGIMPSEAAVHRVLDHMERLPIRHVNPMHGACLPGEALPPYVRALREDSYAYNGTLFGKGVS